MMLQLLSKLLCLVCLHTGLGVQVSSASVNTEHPRTSACQLGMHTGHQPAAEDGGLGGRSPVLPGSGINIYIHSELHINFPNSLDRNPK